MKPEDKKYILENAGKRSVSDIAKTLGLKEKKVRKFIEKDGRAGPSAETAPPPSGKMLTLISIALVVILGFAVYANSIDGQFLWDDFHLVKNNVYIRDWSHIKDIFTEHVGGGAGRTYHFYRPIQILSFLIDHSLWGLNVIGYHITNIVLHILVALCIYWLISILYKDKLLSFLASAIFVVHPVHTEAVSYIAGRADPLAALFMLLCFIFCVKDMRSKRNVYYISAVAAYTLAIFSRESSLILPLLLLLYQVAFKENIKTRSFISVAAIACIYIILRAGVFKFMTTPDIVEVSVLERMPGNFVALTNYIKLLFLPLGLHMEYSEKLFRLSDPRAITGILLFVSLVLIAAKNIRKNNTVFFSIGWFFIALIPFTNIYPINAYMAEHWLYLPSIGFFLLMAKGLKELYLKKAFWAAALIAGLVVFYSFLTVKQNMYWRDPFAFYERTLKYVTDSEVVYNNLGILYGEKGEYEKAIPLFKKSIETNPRYADPYFNLGRAYSYVGKDNEAIIYYDEAIKRYKDTISADTYYNIGNIYKNLGRHEEAISKYNKALEINPRFAYAYNNLGLTYFDMDKYDEAIRFLNKAIEIDPADPYAYSNMAAVYYQKKEYGLAMQYFDKAEGMGLTNVALKEALKPYREEGVD